MENILMGTYININSPIHKLNVKYKMPCLILALAFTVISNNVVMYLINFVVLSLLIIISKIKLKYFLSAVKSLWSFYLIIFCMNSLFYNQGEVLLSFWKINITLGGVRQGAIIVLNVLLVILWSKLFISTSSPIEITKAISFYLKPLRIFKIPTENLALILSVSIQFVPTLLIETQNIKKAQTARGAEFESRNPLKKAKCVIPLIVPIFINAFKRADELSLAIEARGYKGEK